MSPFLGAVSGLLLASVSAFGAGLEADSAAVGRTFDLTAPARQAPTLEVLGRAHAASADSVPPPTAEAPPQHPEPPPPAPPGGGGERPSWLRRAAVGLVRDGGTALVLALGMGAIAGSAMLGFSAGHLLFPAAAGAVGISAGAAVVAVVAAAAATAGVIPLAKRAAAAIRRYAESLRGGP